MVVENTVAYLNSTWDLGITYERGNYLISTVFADADYASKVIDMRSTSGIVVMLGVAAVCVTSRTQHCVTLSTMEAEYVAMIEEFKEKRIVRSVLFFM